MVQSPDELQHDDESHLKLTYCKGLDMRVKAGVGTLKISGLVAAALLLTGCSYGLTQRGIDSSLVSKTVTVKGSVQQVYQSLANEMQGPGCPPIHSSQLYLNGDGFVVYFGEHFIGHSYIWDGAYGKKDGGSVTVSIRDQSYTPQSDFVDEIEHFLKTGSCR